MANNAEMCQLCFRDKKNARKWLLEQNFKEINTDVFCDPWGYEWATLHYFRGRWEISFHDGR
jgi:hypothetical protein